MATSKAKTSAKSAAAGTTAGTQHSDTEHMDKRGGVDFGQDIGQTEAWTANMKRMYDDYAQFAGRNHSDSLDVKNRLAEIAMQDWQARLATDRVSFQSFVTASQNGWNNLTDEEKRIMAQETRHHDLAVDRQWNVDEQSWAISMIIDKLAATKVLDDTALGAVVRAFVKSSE